MLQMMGAFAEFERAVIRERQREGIKKAKAAGKYSHGKPRVKKIIIITGSGFLVNAEYPFHGEVKNLFTYPIEKFCKDSGHPLYKQLLQIPDNNSIFKKIQTK
jgi:DNA invertase Pin-like site-specific DNA recombinase